MMTQPKAQHDPPRAPPTPVAPAQSLDEELDRLRRSVDLEGDAEDDTPARPVDEDTQAGDEDGNIRWALRVGPTLESAPNGVTRHPTATVHAWLANLAYWTTFPERPATIEHNDREALRDLKRIQFKIQGRLEGVIVDG